MLANIFWAFTVAAATVFVAKATPTLGGGALPDVIGFTREGAGHAGQYLLGIHRCRRHRIRG
ncbi:hypothetical protein K4A76_15365 [Pseudomonas sp. NEEL19]|uniref:hypothetical protein n=1 Tax=Pseudomonas sp. NEEL19 TaxID=2867409 RepID=UPI002367AF7F|nr:hypothetical protein [Pseudomonas sp. NEEL19]WDM57845.1 hypothetical protein K4A76_15365 [Pseudomonas sp. NEEL19]